MPDFSGRKRLFLAKNLPAVHCYQLLKLRLAAKSERGPHFSLRSIRMAPQPPAADLVFGTKSVDFGDRVPQFLLFVTSI